LATLDKIPICDRCFLTRHGRGPANPRHVMPLRHSWRNTAVIEERAEDTVMIEGSLEDYLDGIRQLERALLRFMMAAHREGVCGANGAHREECIALFEQLGWEGYEEYLSAMSPIADAEGTSCRGRQAGAEPTSTRPAARRWAPGNKPNRWPASRRRPGEIPIRNSACCAATIERPPSRAVDAVRAMRGDEYASTAGTLGDLLYAEKAKTVGSERDWDGLRSSAA